MQRFGLDSLRFSRQLVGIEDGLEEGQSARKVADENVKFPDVANGFGQLFFVFRIRLQKEGNVSLKTFKGTFGVAHCQIDAS